MTSRKILELFREQGIFIAKIGDEDHGLSNLWTLPVQSRQFTHLLVNDVMQYMTSMEADFAMLKWIDALCIGGEIKIQVPNIDFYLQMWQEATWNNTSLVDSNSKARQAFAGIWGSQSDGNPRDNNYATQEQAVFKSGYNAARLHLLMERAGFCDIAVEENQSNLMASGQKTMDRAERQITTEYDQIRPDHLNRYEFACKKLGNLTHNQSLLDLACGIGYGTLMLANNTGANAIGVDIDEAAVAHAAKHFSNANTQFICQDARVLQLPEGSQDAIVSFETIEHIDFDEQLLAKFHTLLKPDGRLICSTPNQDVMPFNKTAFPFHLKHYTNSELVELLERVGFGTIELYAQHDPKAGEVVSGDRGCFTIAVASKI